MNANPDGLLFHESFYSSLLPLHIGVRQYWRDFETLEKWTRTFPHEKWMKSFLHDPKGTGFWHETYCRQGGMEGIYGMREPVGLLQFARAKPAVGGMLTARGAAEAILRGDDRGCEQAPHGPPNSPGRVCG